MSVILSSGIIVGLMSILFNDRNGRGDTSHVLKHSIKKSPKNVNTIDFKLIDKNFNIINNNEKLPKRYGSKTYDHR